MQAGVEVTNEACRCGRGSVGGTRGGFWKVGEVVGWNRDSARQQLWASGRQPLGCAVITTQGFAATSDVPRTAHRLLAGGWSGLPLRRSILCRRLRWRCERPSAPDTDG